MGYVRKRSGMHEHGRALQRLHEVRHQCVLHQDAHRSRRVQPLCRHRLAAIGLCHDDPAQPLPQILQARGESEDRHHLARHGDVEAGLPRHSILPAEAGDDVVDAPLVVEVDDAAPGDGPGIDVELVPVLEVGIDHRRQQVVGDAHRVHVTGEVEVEVLHRHDLGVAAAGRAALDAEDRAQAWLPDAGHDLLAEHPERLR